MFGLILLLFAQNKKSGYFFGHLMLNKVTHSEQLVTQKKLYN